MGTIINSAGVKNINNSATHVYGYSMGTINPNGGTKTIDICPVDQGGWLQFWVDVRHNNNGNAISCARKISMGDYSTGGVKNNELILPDVTTSGSTIAFSTVSGEYQCILTNNYAGAIYNCRVLIIACGVTMYINGDSANGTF